MSDQAKTIGQAIDQVLSALESMDDRARRTVIATVCAHLDIECSSSGRADADEALSPPSQQTDTRAQTPIDIRALKEKKQPKSAIQMACLVGYYLGEQAPQQEKKATLKCEDLEKYFKQANFKLPNKLSQLLVDAKAAGYFDSAGRGEYKLNAVGYNLVAHSMPSGSSAK